MHAPHSGDMVSAKRWWSDVGKRLCKLSSDVKSKAYFVTAIDANARPPSPDGWRCGMGRNIHTPPTTPRSK
eukprot:8419097-Karenia_brevis.AAC.1